MFSGKRRAIPGQAAPPTAAAAAPPRTTTAAAPSSSSPVNKTQHRPAIIKTTTTTTTKIVKKVVVPAAATASPAARRSVNKYVPPPPPPPGKEQKGKGKANSSAIKGRRGGTQRDFASTTDEEDDERPSKRARPSPPSRSSSTTTGGVSSSRRRRAGEPTTTISSDLDPLTPSEEEQDSDSDLSSADEDYSSRTIKREDGAPVAVRSVAAPAATWVADEAAKIRTTKGGGAGGITSAESLVLQNPTGYRTYFVDPSDPQRPASEWAGGEIPVVELQYPGEGPGNTSERFALLAPRSDDEYNPIEDVMSVILTVLDHFLTPEQASQYFGHAPGKTAFSAFLYNRTSTSSSSAGNSRAGTPSSAASVSVSVPTVPILPSGVTTIPAAAAASAPVSTPGLGTATASEASSTANDTDSAAPSPSLAPPSVATATTTPAAPTASSTESLIRQLEKARSKSDGPGFLAALARYNSTLLSLKKSGIIRRNIEEMKGLREKVWTRVFTQCYDRAVGPGLEDVRKYRAFSDNVYGELLPKFMNEIFARTHLGPKGVFVDLGSGVGNCVVQAALATGAESWGFENMPHASQLARAQVVEAEARFELWGLAGGKMHVREANFCESPEVGEVLRRADVVLVNNEVFTSSLNERLSWLFLELPPSAKIVSLKPFLPPSFKLSSHNVHSPLAILSQYPPLRYTSNCVSWKPEGGTYFLARIDRGRVERFWMKERERERRREGERLERRERREGSAATTTTTASSMSRSGSASTVGAGAGGGGGMSRTTSRQGSQLAHSTTAATTQ
ncbi:hypothetical protein JCM8115_001153 [Rhodotorula mucilaginosa]